LQEQTPTAGVPFAEPLREKRARRFLNNISAQLEKHRISRPWPGFQSNLEKCIESHPRRIVTPGSRGNRQELNF